MSNVLIGIIGVILFIGLALAGALFLGPRFQEATSNSQASAMTAAVKQAVDAAELWRVQEGRQYIPATTTGFLAPGYLKSEIPNPTQADRSGKAAYYWSVHFDNNLHVYDLPEQDRAARYVYAVIGMTGDAKARSICQAVNRPLGIGTIPDFSTDPDAHPASTTGCILAFSRPTADTTPSAAYIVFQRVAPTTQDPFQTSDL